MDTKTTLLDAAERLVRHRGFDAFSYADLATEVGIRKASIHYHFPAKADLALALIQRYRADFFTELSRITAEATTAADQLTRYIAAYRGSLGSGDQVCLCVAFAAGRDSFTLPVIAELNLFHADSIAWLTRVYAAGQADGTLDARDPARAAHATLAQVEGAQLIARAAFDVTAFDLATATLLD